MRKHTSNWPNHSKRDKRKLIDSFLSFLLLLPSSFFPLSFPSPPVVLLSSNTLHDSAASSSRNLGTTATGTSPNLVSTHSQVVTPGNIRGEQQQHQQALPLNNAQKG